MSEFNQDESFRNWCSDHQLTYDENDKCVYVLPSFSNSKQIRIGLQNSRVYLTFSNLDRSSWNAYPNYDAINLRLSEVFHARHYQRSNKYSDRTLTHNLPYTNQEELVADLNDIYDIFTSAIKPFFVKNDENVQSESSKQIYLEKWNLEELLSKTLSIPDYQRGYCWKEENVRNLLDSIPAQDAKIPIHFGTIVLRKNIDTYEVIDGQQRLTTFSIWARNAHPDASLLTQSLRGDSIKEKAINAMKRANLLCQQSEKKYTLEIAKMILFSVVVLTDNTDKDLAYSFFGNVNGRGKRLTDYDILKAHHLRYLSGQDTRLIEKMARRWHSLENKEILQDVLHRMMYRLRNWAHKENFIWHADAEWNEERNLFHHFEAENSGVLLIGTNRKECRFDDILSGGIEFFQYIEKYGIAYQQYKATKVCDLLGLIYNSYLREAIEALGYIFYLKFGEIYLEDGLLSIAHCVSKVRTENGIIRYDSICDCRIIQDCLARILRSNDEGEFFEWCLTKSYKIDRNARSQKGYWPNYDAWKKEMSKRCIVFYDSNESDTQESDIQKLTRKNMEK